MGPRVGRFFDDAPDEREVEVTLVGRDGRTTATPSSEETSDRLSVLIISDRLVTTRPLPASGEVRIGRAHGADLVIDDPSISRSHAVLTIGPPLILRDLGSANGTRVRDRAIAPDEQMEIAPGDVILLGDATLIVQRRGPPVRAQRIWAHDYFEARLEEECARSHRDALSFAVARIHCDQTPEPTVLQEVLLSMARAADVVGEYSPSELELLLVDVEPDDAAVAIARVTDGLRDRGLEPHSGLACFPRDARNAHELIHRASPFSREREHASEAAVSAAIVADRRMQDLYRLAERIAAGNITVLILGETGVGKEVVAERVHRMSPRSQRPYLKLNCAALSESLLESELFGHERGAFTGAVGAKQGLLETAEGGTVFLDEVGELPHSIQVKLLRVLEERVVFRVGGLRPIPLDVRFIAATNRDLESEITRGTFRQDLFFRLNGATLVIPPLRERTQEIPNLARAFASQGARQMNMDTTPSIAPEALEVLLTYSWPGNIRELRNMIERAVLLCGRGPILPAHLPLEKMRATFGVQPPAPAAPTAPFTGPGAISAAAGGTAAFRPVDRAGSGAVMSPASAAGTGPIHRAGPADPFAGRGRPASPTVRPHDDATVQVVLPPDQDDELTGSTDSERMRILQALAECAGNQTAAARKLGIARRTLINKLELYGISGPRKKR